MTAHAKPKPPAPSPGMRRNMDNFNARSVAEANSRRADREHGEHSDGAEIARTVLGWRPAKPPGKGGTPAGDDGGRSLFEGKLFRIDNVYNGDKGSGK